MYVYAPWPHPWREVKSWASFSTERLVGLVMIPASIRAGHEGLNNACVENPMNYFSNQLHTDAWIIFRGLYRSRATQYVVCSKKLTCACLIHPARLTSRVRNCWVTEELFADCAHQTGTRRQWRQPLPSDQRCVVRCVMQYESVGRRSCGNGPQLPCGWSPAPIRMARGWLGAET
jgi:hypothetical protein